MRGLLERRGWRRLHTVAQWFLIVSFAFLAVVHVGLTVLYFVGVWDTGVGFVLGWEWPAWSITLIDGTAVWLLWSAKKGDGSDLRRRLVMTILAGVLVVARAAWFVLVPVAAFILILDVVAATRGGRPDRVAT